MKLRKEELKDLLNARMEWHLDNAEFLRSQGFSGKENDDLYERYEALLNNLEDGTLEIEGYEQPKWVKLDPNDESTYPQRLTRVLVCDKNKNVFESFVLINNGIREFVGNNVTHWRPLPKPPAETETKHD
jgi:hypothetical protein